MNGFSCTSKHFPFTTAEVPCCAIICAVCLLANCPLCFVYIMQHHLLLNFTICSVYSAETTMQHCYLMVYYFIKKHCMQNCGPLNAS